MRIPPSLELPGRDLLTSLGQTWVKVFTLPVSTLPPGCKGQMLRTPGSPCSKVGGESSQDRCAVWGDLDSAYSTG
jgi:hypothetical protein